MKTSKLLCSSQTKVERFDHTMFYGNIKWQEGDISQFRHIPIPLNAMHKLLNICEHFVLRFCNIFRRRVNVEKNTFREPNPM